MRDRTDLASWRLNMRDDIRDNGLRWPILVFGHSPKGPINNQYITDFNRDRDMKNYIMIGTNRYWCLWDLGWDVFPAIYSLNKGETPPKEWGESWKVSPSDFPKYSPDDCFRIWVREHAFGYKPLEWPSVEFGEQAVG